MSSHWVQILFTMVACIVSGCCCKSNPPIEPNSIPTVNTPEIVHVIQDFLPYLRYEKHLRLEDARIYFNDTINTIRLEFTSQDVLSMDEGRHMLVDLVEGLLAQLNRNPLVAADILTYPLTADSLEIYIDFESFYDAFIDPYYLGWIQLEGGTATYYAFDSKYPGRNTWDYRIESYAKSLELTLFEREGENLFRSAIYLEQPTTLDSEQYLSPTKQIPRYFSPYKRKKIFER